MDEYKQTLEKDLDLTKKYYQKSMIKTEQQKMLELLLEKNNNFKKYKKIGDIACGGGTLSYHVSKINEESEFILIDYLDSAIELAKINNKDNDKRFTFEMGDIYNLQIKDNELDATFCWMTLSWLDNPEKALNELLRVTKKGGKIYLSSLFNIDNDCDIYSRVYDNSRKSGKDNNYMRYNTYSMHSIKKWIGNKVNNIHIHTFNPNIDFEYDGKGVGSYTKKLDNGERIQISAGMLLNWGILEIDV